MIGEVSSPGFYQVDATTQISQADLIAGGPNSWRYKDKVELLWVNRNGSIEVKKISFNKKGLSNKIDKISLRNGDIIKELRDEVDAYEYDLTIIGGSAKRSMSHDMIQYINSSIFVVNNFNKTINYKILLAVDDSPGTKKAVKYGVRVAQAFGIKVQIITVNEDDNSNEANKKSSDAKAKSSKKSSDKAAKASKTGDDSDQMGDEAEDTGIEVQKKTVKVNHEKVPEINANKIEIYTGIFSFTIFKLILITNPWLIVILLVYMLLIYMSFLYLERFLLRE